MKLAVFGGDSVFAHFQVPDFDCSNAFLVGFGLVDFAFDFEDDFFIFKNLSILTEKLGCEFDCLALFGLDVFGNQSRLHSNLIGYLKSLKF